MLDHLQPSDLLMLFAGSVFLIVFRKYVGWVVKAIIIVSMFIIASAFLFDVLIAIDQVYNVQGSDVDLFQSFMGE